MSSVTDVEIENFVGELLEILTDLCRTCSELDGDEGRKNIERGLHTIKGNAVCFGFLELSKVASRVLEAVRADSRSDTERGASLAPLILEFVTRSRQYLGLVRPGRPLPEEFFGGIFQSFADQLGVHRPQELTPTSNHARSESTAEASLGEEIQALLAEAPPVKPDLSKLSELGAKRLNFKRVPKNHGPAAGTRRHGEPPISTAARKEGRPGRRAGAASEPVRRSTSEAATIKSAAPCLYPAAAPGEVDEGQLAWGVRGFAFEALCAGEALSAMKTEMDQNPELNRRTTHLLDLLMTFSQWALGSRMVSLERFLAQSADEVRSLFEGSGLDFRISVGEVNIPLLPILGRYIQRALVDTLRGLLPLSKDHSEKGLALGLSAANGPGGMEIRVSGLNPLTSSAAWLRIDLVRRRFQEIGGELVTSAYDQDLVIRVPGNLHSMD